MSSSGIRVKRGERLPDKELSLEAGAKRGGDPKIEGRRGGKSVVGERRGEVNGGAARGAS
jgi:hypothetical protein